MKKPIFLGIFAVFILAGAGLFWHTQPRERVFSSPDLLEAQQLAAAQELIANPEEGAELTAAPLPLSADAGPDEPLAEPIDGFANRITKKPFGLFITPETSPVQPDRFTGYHNAVDVEYGDAAEEIPVRAVANGTVVMSQFAYGYGGVVVIRHAIGNREFLALYGHLNPASIPRVGTVVIKNQVVGVLGDGGTEETDGARKHLHFAILRKTNVDIRGYVRDAAELEGWYNPLELYTGT